MKQGQNLILNMNDKGFNVVAFNRTTSKVDAFLANEAKGSICLRHLSSHDLILMVRYKCPRRTFNRGARRQAQNTPQDHPSGKGWICS